MQPTKTLRFLLTLSGAIAAFIGGTLLLDPASFHASNGIELGTDPNLFSEVRAPGGALFVLGLLIGVGAFVRSFAATSASMASAVYLAYGGSRLVSMWLDGMPGSGLVLATAIELLLGGACALAWLHASRRKPVATRAPSAKGEAA